MSSHGFTYGGETILSNPIFVETILPFLLVFTIVFAVLQKSKILGEDKKQIDAIIALVIGLLVISFAQATGIILQLIPFMAVSLIVFLVFLILVGSFRKSGEDVIPKGFASFLMYLVLIGVTIAVVYITGFWQWIIDAYYSTDTSILGNIVFVVIIIAVVAFVLKSASGGDSKKD
jgi:hypothetical protein